jgi:hypothetical protein
LFNDCYFMRINQIIFILLNIIKAKMFLFFIPFPSISIFVADGRLIVLNEV